MIYLISGEDSFRAEYFIREQKKDFFSKHPHGAAAIFADEATLEEALNFLQAASLFPEQKFVVFRGKIGVKEFTKIKKLGAAIEEDPSRIFLLWLEGVKKAPAAFTKLPGIKKHFPPLKGLAQGKWLEELGRDLGIHLSQGALSLLLSLFGHDSRQLFFEAKKLSDFKPNSQISELDVLKISSPVLSQKFFVFIEAFLQKDKKNAMKSFLEEVRRGGDPIGLLAALTNTFRTILILHLAKNRIGTPQALKGQHPYWLSKLRLQSRTLSEAEIRQAFQRLSTLDWQVKTGRLEAGAALEEFVYSWLSGFSPSKV